MPIAILGSINMDLLVQTPRLPAAGETLIGNTFLTAPGGKGANQAVAAARLGCSVFMFGRVGNDVFGDALRKSLIKNRVDVNGVTTESESSSGVAVIAVDDHAENSIVVVPGANGRVGAEDVERMSRVLSRVDVLLLQLEIPMDAVLAAARVARQNGVTVILDPAPAQPLPAKLYELTDIITPNEVEAGTLSGFPVHNREDAAQAAKILQERGVPQVIIKMGAQGAYFANGNSNRFFPAYSVKAIDTVAAGDAFNGAFAVALSEKKPFPEAIRWGMAAGALATTKSGAQPSMPDRNAVERLLQQ
jgi:ribokinase